MDKKIKLKTFFLINKSIITDIIFYLHLSLGFLIASFVAMYFEIDHTKVALVWSIVFIFLMIEKTKENFNK